MNEYIFAVFPVKGSEIIRLYGWWIYFGLASTQFCFSFIIQNNENELWKASEVVAAGCFEILNPAKSIKLKRIHLLLIIIFWWVLWLCGVESIHP